MRSLGSEQRKGQVCLKLNQRRAERTQHTENCTHIPHNCQAAAYTCESAVQRGGPTVRDTIFPSTLFQALTMNGGSFQTDLCSPDGVELVVMAFRRPQSTNLTQLEQTVHTPWHLGQQPSSARLTCALTQIVTSVVLILVCLLTFPGIEKSLKLVV